MLLVQVEDRRVHERGARCGEGGASDVEEVEDDEVAPRRRALAVPVPVSAPDAGERSGR